MIPGIQVFKSSINIFNKFNLHVGNLTNFVNFYFKSNINFLNPDQKYDLLILERSQLYMYI